MSEIDFAVVDDVVIKSTPMPEMGENIYKTEVVMTKEIFQECYKKWIVKDWLSTFNTDSATACFTAVQELKRR